MPHENNGKCIGFGLNLVRYGPLKFLVHADKNDYNSIYIPVLLHLGPKLKLMIISTPTRCACGYRKSSLCSCLSGW